MTKFLNDINLPEFTKKDYFESTTPFEWLYKFKDDKFKLKQMTSIIAEKAGTVGVKNFVSLFNAYISTINSKNGILQCNTTDFEGQKIELECGEWVADEFGVSSEDKYGFEIIACNHPILPVQRLINIDSGIEKLKLEFKKGKSWRSIIADKQTLASNNSILQLAAYGIAVNSENSKYLVKYLSDIEHLNYTRIEELNSVGRLGWIENYGFSPYVDNLVFDGDSSFKSFFESVKKKGSFEKWVELCLKIRKENIYAKIMLAASFASVLVEPCDCLPFFVHLWGGSEAGKTVALMLAASVWANPEMGRYIHTFNSTAVAQELSAGFVNSMPLMLDELMIKQDRKSFDDMIYSLSEGVGRARGQKTGGLQKTLTWKNCILTTGEKPISSENSGSGAVNRIVEIDCKELKIFKDPHEVVETIRSNYGHAGELFIKTLMDKENYKLAAELQKIIYLEVSKKNVTEKQAMSASLILTADTLIESWIFHDGELLKTSDVEQFLSSNDDISQNLKALRFLEDFIAINSNKFSVNEFGTYQGEIWGAIDCEYYYIIKSQFDKIMIDNGFSSAAFLSWAKEKNLIKTQGGKNTCVKRIRSVKNLTRCVCIKKLTENCEVLSDLPDMDDI